MLVFIAAWRLAITLWAAVSSHLIPYLGNFAYAGDLIHYQLPPWLLAWANFDGLYYLRIAEHSYQQYEQAFFPLFPLLIRLVAPLVMGNTILAGLLIANLALLLATLLLARWLKKELPQAGWWPIYLLLMFPTAFFLGAVYTESLFLLLVVLTLIFISNKHYGWAAIMAYFAALTRLMGLFLFIPLLLPLLKPQGRKWRVFFLPLFPIAGLLTYMIYLYWSVGDPLAFFHSQSVFGAARSTKLVVLPQVVYRYFKIFLTTSWSYQYFVALLEFVFFATVLAVLLVDLIKQWRQKNQFLLAVNLFSLINILLPTLTGSFLSVPRFSLLSLSFFLYLGSLPNKMLKGIITVIFALGQIVLLTLFIQGYFIS